ncbi:hypothetical protein HanPSC8_Chr10g0416661 [Helianthus annuus]|nr:hypothetical protein HanPSC8_Chr10g0416661 [Helianthus annuus]
MCSGVSIPPNLNKFIPTCSDRTSVKRWLSLYKTHPYHSWVVFSQRQKLSLAPSGQGTARGIFSSSKVGIHSQTIAEVGYVELRLATPKFYRGTRVLLHWNLSAMEAWAMLATSSGHPSFIN